MSTKTKWRNAANDPPTMTGIIITWDSFNGPSIVAVEETYMAVIQNGEEIENTDPSEWEFWIELNEPTT